MRADADERPRPGCVDRLALFISRIAFLAVVAAWCVQLAWGESSWLTAAVTFAPPIIYLAIPTVALLFALWARHRRAIWTSAIGLGLALATVARPSLNVHRGPTRTMDTIRVVTWNVHGQIQQIPEFRAELTALVPDIVCLQEANHDDFRQCLPDAEMARGGEIMTLVQGELVSSRRVRDDEGRPWFRSPLETRIKLPQADLTVFNVHLQSYQAGSLPNMGTRETAKEFTERAISRRGQEAGYLFRQVRGMSGPKLVVGDLNLPPRGRLYGSFSRLLTDAFAASGNGFGWTFPRHRPLWRIDFVWTSAELEPLDCRTLGVGPSDHYPVVADIRIR